MPILLPEERNIQIPELFKYSNKFDYSHINNIEEVVRQEALREIKRAGIVKGMKVALSVGSRGIGNLIEIVQTLIHELKCIGAMPYVVGAMGSHGGGEENAQKKILEELGLQESVIGVPVITKQDVISIGNLDSGENIYFSKAAYDADKIIIINRIKPHTDFDGKGDIESGICKMSVIGLGNHKGCVEIHRAGIEKFPGILIEASQKIFHSTNIAFGIGIVENAVGKPCIIKAIPVNAILEEERKLIKEAKKRMARLPFKEIDVLIIEEIGKDISGSGADPNIIGRLGPKKDSDYVPNIKCIVILGLSKKSGGNATGVGFADVITEDMFQSINREVTYANCLAGGSKFGLDCARIPIIMKNEKEALLAAMKISGKKEGDECKMIQIKNTKELEEIKISKAFL